jgi:hypothetical protein
MSRHRLAMSGAALWLGVALVSGGVAGAVVTAGGQPAQAETQGPFVGLTGSWRGAAQIRLSSGDSETLKCNAYYTPRSAGAELGLAIRCASASNRIELRAQLAHAGGRVTGQWEERTYNASGEVTGKASDGKLALSISGAAFKGSMDVRTTGASQTVSIQTEGIALRGVSINLSRG